MAAEPRCWPPSHPTETGGLNWNRTNMDQKFFLDGDPVAAQFVTEVRREEALLKAGALQKAIFNSANFSSIATDAKGVI